MLRIYIAVMIVLSVNLVLGVRHHHWKNNTVINWDVGGYYLYLPATFIYNDISGLSFYDYVDSVYKPAGTTKRYGLYEQSQTNRVTNKYSLGTSIAEMPVFILGHLYTKYFCDDQPADGYSRFYQLSVLISTILWSSIGLLILGLFLRNYFPDTDISLVLIVLGLGTNLYCYTWLVPGMSHPLVFMFFAIVLYYTQRWHTTYKARYAWGLGLFLGWILITRPVDFSIVLLPLFWPFDRNGAGVASKFQLLWKYRSHVFFAVVACLILVSIQCLYWRYTTGSFIHYSYGTERFYFNDPEILQGLFGYSKGWFLYTPVAFLGVLGFFPLYLYYRSLVWPVVLFLSLLIYLVFSWWMWWYGWGYGCRPLIEALAVMSVPLCALSYRLRTGLSIVGRGIVLSVVSFLVWLNIYQTEQFKVGTLPGDRVNKAYYWRIWNRMHVDDRDRELLK